jgi:hypothetical protein
LHGNVIGLLQGEDGKICSPVGRRIGFKKDRFGNKMLPGAAPYNLGYPTMTTARASLKLLAGAALLAMAGALAGCQTTGAGSQASAESAPPPKPPMTHAHAAMECWMSTEKGRADIALDKRADIVTKCIDEKMKAAKAGASAGKQASAKKP